MTFILFGFRKKKHLSSERKRAIAFVDYEHWYISLNNLYGIKPDIRAWRAMLSEKYDIKGIYFFGNFSNPALRAEISKIREISNLIIETQNSTSYYKKDFTDFIMLDHIYQSAIDSDNVDAFIIFTGDGHFSSVVSYLVTKCRKEVGIFAVRDALSSQLKNSASYSVTVPSNEELTLHIERLIIKSISTVYAENAKPRPTFLATVEAVAKNNSIGRDIVSSTLNSLIKDGIIYQKRIRVGYNKTIKILAINHQSAKKRNIME
ncbi:MAG: NYN domain-containing protein [Ruminococcaceae bacterium]|nr:NYN domain-containing protein [Oscillospiraceae bacterium]